MSLRSFPLSSPVKLRAVAIQTCAKPPPPLPQILLLAVLFLSPPFPLRRSSLVCRPPPFRRKLPPSSDLPPPTNNITSSAARYLRLQGAAGRSVSPFLRPESSQLSSCLFIQPSKNSPLSAPLPSPSPSSFVTKLNDTRPTNSNPDFRSQYTLTVRTASTSKYLASHPSSSISGSRFPNSSLHNLPSFPPDCSPSDTGRLSHPSWDLFRGRGNLYEPDRPSTRKRSTPVLREKTLAVSRGGGNASDCRTITDRVFTSDLQQQHGYCYLCRPWRSQR